MSVFHHPLKLGPVPQTGPSVLRNTVLLGDCIEVLSGLPDGCVDFVLTDPPYGCRYTDRSGRQVANDDNTKWIAPAFAEIHRVMRRNSYCISFYGWHVADDFIAAWRAAGFTIAGHLVFPKAYASSERVLAQRHEQAYLLAKGRPKVPGPALSDVRGWAYTGNKLHPTQKPTAVLQPLIAHFSVPGELVLDPFCGSGSTMVAAQQASRDWLGIDIDASHHATARRRLGS